MIRFVCDNSVFSDTTSLLNYLMDNHPYRLLKLYCEEHMDEPMPTGYSIFTDTCYILHDWFYKRAIEKEEDGERYYNVLFLKALDVYVKII